MYFNAVSTVTVVLRLLGAEAATDRLWPFNCQERFFLIHLQLEGCNIDRMCTLCVIQRRRSVIIHMDKGQLIRLECQYQLSENARFPFTSRWFNASNKPIASPKDQLPVPN